MLSIVSEVSRKALDDNVSIGELHPFDILAEKSHLEHQQYGELTSLSARLTKKYRGSYTRPPRAARALDGKKVLVVRENVDATSVVIVCCLCKRLLLPETISNRHPIHFKNYTFHRYAIDRPVIISREND